MRPRLTSTIVLVVAVIASVLPSERGHAAGNDGAWTGHITAEVMWGRAPGSGRSGTGADSSGCVWTPAEHAITLGGNMVVDRVDRGVAYHLFIRTCPSSVVNVWVPRRSAASLAADARARVEELLQVPVVGSAPAVGRGIVKVGMWFWTDPGRYREQSVTAWVPTPAGVLSATTTARPVRLEFAPGEPGGETASCAGPGQVWTPADGDDAASACMYTYRHSSAVSATGVFEASMSIVWEITWRASTGATGTSGEVRTTTTTPVTVNELQALVVD